MDRTALAPSTPAHCFRGLWIPLVTPFGPDGTPDLPALAALTRRVRADGARGLVALGTTGEPATLDEAEQDAVLDTIVTHAEGAPVIAGLSGVHPGALQARLRRLARHSLHGLLVPAPSYVRPSQGGLLDHFRRLADASPIPLVLYDIPYRTGVTLELDTLLTLAAHPMIQALKDCGGDLDKTQQVVADGRLAVLSGDDARIFATLCLGGQGAIAASAHVHTPAFAALVDAALDGDLSTARALHHALAPWVRACFAEPSPAGVKAALTLLQPASAPAPLRADLRSPLQAASPALVQRLRTLLLDTPNPQWHLGRPAA